MSQTRGRRRSVSLETWDSPTVSLATIEISDRCTACANCIITCPVRALSRAPKKPLVSHDLCNSCGECIEVCPVGAITERSGTATFEFTPALIAGAIR